MRDELRHPRMDTYKLRGIRPLVLIWLSQQAQAVALWLARKVARARPSL